MKVAILCESDTDEAAVRILVSALLKEPADAVLRPSLRSGGWSAVKNALSAVLRDVHYCTDAEALAIIVDSDDSPIHDAAHDEPHVAVGRCRTCQLREIIARTQLKPRPHGNPVKVAVAVAVPAIEAWYRCSRDEHNNEREWSKQLAALGNMREQRLALKRQVYGSETPPRQHALQRATEEATRLAQDLDVLKRQFPAGFGLFAEQIASWKA
jgi:hypothetical protein